MLLSVQALPILLTVASLWLVAAVTPGPNSVLIMRVSVGQRRQALWAVAGIGAGTCIWGLSGFFGVHALFRAAPFLYWAFRICGGIYLILFGLGLIWASLRRDGAPAEPEAKRPGLSPFQLGLATSLSNPKSALSVASLFAATMPSQAPLGLGLMTVAVMVAISMAWYAFMAWLFTGRWIAEMYRSLRREVDRLAGAVFIFFGARMVLDR